MPAPDGQPTAPPQGRVPLPPQPDAVPWPTDEWPTGDMAEVGVDAARIAPLLDQLCGSDADPITGRTYGLAVVAGGRLVVERYGRRVVQDLRALEPGAPLDDLGPDDQLLSWSMAKSITDLAVGTAVGDGRVALTDPVADPRWSAPGDPRARITWDDLLAMRPGLAWQEEYVDNPDGSLPDVLTMLFAQGKNDMAAYAAGKELVAEPGSEDAYRYSSGTTNIVAAALQRELGLDADGFEAYLRERIFDPIGMGPVRVQHDAAGTFIGSSYVHATLRDWCRFGLLALRGGVWDGQRITPEGWIDRARWLRTLDDEKFHTNHWWAWDRPDQVFGAHGYEGQRVLCFPTRDLVIARLGQTPSDGGRQLTLRLFELAESFPEHG